MDYYDLPDFFLNSYSTGVKHHLSILNVLSVLLLMLSFLLQFCSLLVGPGNVAPI